MLKQISRTEAAIADIVARLTVSPDPLIVIPTAEEPDFAADLPEADLTVWFDDISIEDVRDEFYRVGLGQVLAFAATGAVMEAPGAPTGSTTSYGNLEFPIRGLAYRVPRRMKITLSPKAEFAAHPGLDHLERALARAAHAATTAKATIDVPQLGALKVIRFDGSGLFGSRAVAATFSLSGQLTSVGYATNGGADALAGAGDALVAAGTELRDARLNALKREVEFRTKVNELEDLIEDAAECAG